MPLNTSELQIAAAAMAADINSMSLHSGNPGANGTANETTAARQTIACTATGGNLTVPQAAFTGVAANGPVTYLGLWNGTNFRGAFALTGDQSANAAGQYTVDSWQIPNTAA